MRSPSGRIEVSSVNIIAVSLRAVQPGIGCNLCSPRCNITGIVANHSAYSSVVTL
jgi:hypothetical protein